MAEKKTKKVAPKESVKETYIGAVKLDDKKKYKLTQSQRAMLKPKATSMSTMKEEVTGEELNKMLKRVKSNPVSFGIKK